MLLFHGQITDILFFKIALHDQKGNDSLGMLAETQLSLPFSFPSIECPINLPL